MSQRVTNANIKRQIIASVYTLERSPSFVLQVFIWIVNMPVRCKGCIKKMCYMNWIKKNRLLNWKTSSLINFDSKLIDPFYHFYYYSMLKFFCLSQLSWAIFLLSPHFGQMRRCAVIKMGLEDIHATYCWIGLAREFGLNCPCICILLRFGLNKR
jgi:hypothetical protein